MGSKLYANETSRPSACICIFSALYAPHVGGVETFTEGIASALAKLGHRIIVITMNTNDAPVRENARGVEIVRLPALPFLGGRYPIQKQCAESEAQWEWLREQDIDAVVINTRFYQLSSLGAAFAKIKGITPLLIEHGSAHLTFGNALADIPLHAIEHAATSKLKHYKPDCYGVSFKASEWLRHFGLASHGEITNAIDADGFIEQASQRDFRQEYGIPRDALLLSFAGRFVPEKGALQLANAVTTLTQKNANCDVYLVMAGDGLLFDRVNHIATTSNGHVVLPKMLSKPDLAALLLQSNAFVLPSRSEGFSTVLLEAAAASNAIISTDVGGMREIAPDKSYGILLQSMDSSEIQNALVYAQNHREAIQTMGSNAASRVRDAFSWDKSAKALLDSLFA